MLPRVVAGFVFVLAILALADKGHADAIDGSWCSPAGEQVTIDGEDVTTPGGKQIKGAYTRHTMVFEIPEGEPGAGKKLYFEQLHEEAARVTTIAPSQAEPGPHEQWTRCQTIS